MVEESVDRQLKVNRWERLTMVLMLHLGSKVLIEVVVFFIVVHVFLPVMVSQSPILQAI